MRLCVLVVGCMTLAAQIPVPQVLRIDQIRELEARVAQYPDNTASVRLLADNYALVIVGVTSLNKMGLPDRLDSTLPASEFAGHARQALNDSKLPLLIGEGATALWKYRMGGVGAMVPRELQKDAGHLSGQLLDRAIALDPKNSDWRGQRIEATILNSNFNGLSAPDAWTSVKADLDALSGDARYYNLAHAAELAEHAGKADEAVTLAQELLSNASGRKDWNTSNALHAGNLVLGKVALDRGDVAAAEAYLIESASSIPTGSPQLNSFGPNMSLALALLKAGHQKAVLQYFELCRAFWKMGGTKLDTWSSEVADGKTPQFGANLVY
jgi:hypothetical protein